MSPEQIEFIGGIIIIILFFVLLVVYTEKLNTDNSCRPIDYILSPIMKIDCKKL